MADGRIVRTVEDLERDGQLDPVQQGFIECHGLQCGFCTPGMMMTARWLLDRNPDPAEAEIREVLSGQVCRCTGYENIVSSVRWAAQHPGEPAHDRGLRPDAAQGGPAVRPRPGHLRGRRAPARHALRRGAAQPAPARQDPVHRHRRGRGAPQGQGGHHRRDADRTQPGLDADPVRRHPGRAGHRQGAVPGPGGGVRGGRGPLRRPGRARADRRGVRAAARGGRRPPRAGRRRPARPRRPGEPDQQPHLRLGVRRRRTYRGRSSATPR